MFLFDLFNPSSFFPFSTFPCLVDFFSKGTRFILFRSQLVQSVTLFVLMVGELQ
jgi:hypothetical protein